MLTSIQQCSRPALCLLTLAVVCVSRSTAEDKQPVERGFTFRYAAELIEVEPGAKVRMWVPIPPRTEDQDVKVISADFPGEAKETSDAKFGNRMYYVEFDQPQSQPTKLNLKYQIERKERNGFATKDPASVTEEQLKPFRQANRLVPLSGRPKQLIADISFKDSTVEIARKLYDVVYSHMDYDKSKPGYGNGDVIWACDSRTGNCSDFHSVFISLCRIRNIPAKFQIGFPVPADRGSDEIAGYHCWAQFYDESAGWIPVDISEADKHPEMQEFFFGNLDENRVEFSTGRDIVLEPKQAGEPLNFFIYPYVEVNGEVLPQEQIKLAFSYKDVE